MTWTRIARPTRSAARVTVVSVRVTAKGFTGPRLIINVARATAAAAGIPVDRHGRVDLWSGDGDDAGRIRVAANPIGAFVAHRKGPRAALRIVALLPPGSPQEWPSTPCVTAAGDGEIIFTLPWHEASEQDAQGEDKPTGDNGEPAAGRAFGAADDRTGSPPEPWSKDEPAAEEPPSKPPAGPAQRAVEEWANGREASTTIADEPDEPGQDESAPPPMIPAATPAAAVKPRRVHRARAAAASPDSTPPAQPRPFPYFQAPSKPSAKPAPGKRLFRHNGDDVALDAAHHAIATKLKAAMGKGFLPYDLLITAGALRDVDQLKAAIATMRKKIWPLGLRIGEIDKMGFYMREGNERVADGPVSEARP